MLGYALEVVPDDNDTLLITCPRLPEVTTFAESEGEIQAHASAAIGEALAARIANGQPAPAPEWIDEGARAAKLPTLTYVKVSLYAELSAAGITRAELTRRLGWHREQTDRLFRLDHTSQLEQLDQAFEALGRGLAIVVDPRRAA